MGILAHHRELMRSGGEAARRAAAAPGCGDAGNSDSAFLFRAAAASRRNITFVETAPARYLFDKAAPRPGAPPFVETIRAHAS